MTKFSAGCYAAKVSYSDLLFSHGATTGFPKFTFHFRINQLHFSSCRRKLWPSNLIQFGSRWTGMLCIEVGRHFVQKLSLGHATQPTSCCTRTTKQVGKD